jgi:hypothetical protein
MGRKPASVRWCCPEHRAARSPPEAARSGMPPAEARAGTMCTEQVDRRRVASADHRWVRPGARSCPATSRGSGLWNVHCHGKNPGARALERPMAPGDLHYVAEGNRAKHMNCSPSTLPSANLSFPVEVRDLGHTMLVTYRTNRGQTSYYPGNRATGNLRDRQGASRPSGPQTNRGSAPGADR